MPFSVIIVNYKNESQTVRFVNEELLTLTDELDCIVIVNNAASECSNSFMSKELKAEIVTDTYHGNSKKVIIPCKDNLGFAKGNNVGVRFVDKYIHSEFILFTNNDIRIIDKNILEVMGKCMKSNKDIGILGPKVIGKNLEFQSPEPYINIWKRYVLMYISTLFLSSKKKRELFELDYSSKAEEGFHYKIMGSFFVVRLSDFIRCGMMDEHTFLYAEEPILSERMASIKKAAYYLPKVTIVHEHGGTTEKYMNTIQRCMIQFDSDAYYYHKYKKVPLVEIFIIKIIYKLICKTKAFHEALFI